MSLIICPECQSKVSDKAVICISCGFPLKSLHIKPAKPRKKRLKFPNGYGSVYCLSGTRRRPWVAAKTFGWEQNDQTMRSKQIKRPIGYFETEQDAIAALVSYNKNPYDIDAESITLDQVRERWIADYYPTLSNRSSERTYNSAYNYCASIKNMRMRDIRPSHIEGVIKDCTAGDATKARIKSLFNLIYKFCLKHEIVDKDYAQLVNSVKVESQIDRVPYTLDEIRLLWDKKDSYPAFACCLFQLYTGVRPNEALTAETDSFNLDEWYFVGGSKTEAGIDRVIPIHPDIRSLVSDLHAAAVSKSWPYIFMAQKKHKGDYLPITYDAYRGQLKRSLKEIGITHHPADCRHTYITFAKEQQMDEYLLKLIVGHQIEDVTEKVYTHRKISELIAASAALTFC